MNTFVTSDWHFCHDREFIWKSRGFSSVDEMNEAIVERHNSVVRPGDNVIVLGDLMLNDTDKGMELLGRLNGNFSIILGNHDTDNRINYYYHHYPIASIEVASRLKIGKYNFYLSHYPTLTSNTDNNSPKRAILNLYGHTHQKDNFFNNQWNMYHVGMDSHDCFPVNIETVIEDIKNKYKESKCND